MSVRYGLQGRWRILEESNMRSCRQDIFFHGCVLIIKMIMFIMMMINSSVLVHFNILIFPRECEEGSRIIRG